MSTSLTGKVALVTGASRGIGAATARLLAQEGARVAVNYTRRREAAESLVAEIRAAGGDAEAFQADVGRPEEAERLVQETLRRFARLDILVNNAGVAEGAELSNITPEHFDHQFEVNVRGPLLLSREAARVMGPGSRIINLSSGMGIIPAPGFSVYAATKAALNSLTASHAAELGPRAITVNAVAPGTTDTEMLRAGNSDEALEKLVAVTPLGRLGLPEDVADVVVFLASEQARWITGQVIAASGGLR